MMKTAVAVSPIYDVLARAGIEFARGKMVCSECKERKVTASESKGIAKCWGCGASWTEVAGAIHLDSDWGSYLITKIASRCQDYLSKSIEVQDYLDHRRIPTNNKRWLEDQDIGAVPPLLQIKDIVLAASTLFQEAINRMEAERKELEPEATKGTKAVKAKAETERFLLQIKIERETSEFQHCTEKILPLLQNPKWHNAMVYIYRDQNGEPCSLNIRQFSTEPGDRTVMRVQPHAGRRGCFGVGNAQYSPGAAWPKDFPRLIIVEGEHNLLSLQAASEQWGLDYFIPAMAVGGKDGADIDCIAALAGGDEALVIYDNDKPNPLTGKPGGYELVAAVAEQMYCRAATTPTKDLDDYIVAAPGLTPEKFFRDVLLRMKRVPINIETVAAQVKLWLGIKIEANAREIAVTNIVVADAIRRTQLYNVGGYALLLQPAGDVTAEYVLVREGDASLHDFLRQYGIAKPAWVAACAMAINAEAARLSTPRRTLHSISAWVNGALYVNCYEGSMLRISVVAGKIAIDRVATGQDGVLMHVYAHSLTDTEAKTRPWLDPDFDLQSVTPGALRHDPESLLERGILGRVLYTEHPTHYKQLLKCWILSTFFATTQRSKPVPMLEGNGGGGKTSVGVALGNVLIGPSFTQTNAPATGKELAELMTGRPFVVFDEWSQIPKGVEKEFKSLTTGGTFKTRELYTTSTVVELSCDAAVMTTTNANPTREVATSRRFMVVPVAPRQLAAGEKVYSSTGEFLLPELMAIRSVIWTELLADLSACVLALHATDPATKTSFSMADFGVWVQRIADHEGWGDAAHQMFTAVEKKQEQQTIETQPLAELLPEYFRSCPTHQGKFFTAREWCAHFQSVIPETDGELRRKVTANYVRYIFKIHADLYRRRFGLAEDIDRHAKLKLFALRLPKHAPVGPEGEPEDMPDESQETA
jgi:hypothetical protein